MRCDVNLSMRRKGETKLGTRCEIKNVNSIRFVMQAIDYESARQVEVLKAGGTIKEELKNYDAEKKLIQYKVVDPTDPAVLPVNNYSAKIIVEASGSGSKVEWDAAFYRWFLNNNPPEGQNEAAAKGAIEKIVKESLANLKSLAETK